MSRPIKKGVRMVEPTRVDAAKVKASRSASSARYRGKAIPDKHLQLSVGKVFVFISFPFSLWLLMNALSDPREEKLVIMLIPFCASAAFGLKSYTTGAIASLVLTTVGLVIRFTT